MSRFPFTRWEPWVGRQYPHAGFKGCRLLIIGESHYVSSPQEMAELGKNRFFTQEVVRLQWTGESWAYFTKIAKAVTGEDNPDKESFWNQVVFYNYVQDIVGIGPRKRPTKEHWQEAAGILPKVIEELEPQYILATGKELWNQLPSDWHPGPVLKEQNWETCVGKAPNGSRFLATYMMHPSSPYCGAGLDWAPRIREFLSLTPRL